MTVDAGAASLAQAVRLYQGSLAAPTATVPASHGAGTAAGMALGTFDTVSLGNIWSATSAASSNRSLQTAALSDVRVYGGVLAGNEVETVRQEGSGPYPRAAADWDETTKNAQRAAGANLLAAIQAAIGSHTNSLTVAKGDYRFSTYHSPTGGEIAHINMSASNLTIDFQGSTLWFETDASAIALAGTNVTLKNAYFDWDPLPYVQGTVVGIGGGGTQNFDVQLDPGYFRVPEDMAAGGSGSSWRGFLFDSAGNMKENHGSFDAAFSWSARQPDGSYRIGYSGFSHETVAQSGMAVGDRVVILKRMHRAVRLDGSVGCTLQDIVLYSSPFIAFEQNTGSGTVFRRCAIRPRPGTGRLMGGNADGFNCGNMSPGPTLDQCAARNIGDDAVNIFGHAARVISQTQTNEVVCSRLNYRGNIASPVTVKFYDRASGTCLGSYQATATAGSVTLASTNCAADIVNYPWHSGAAATMAYGKAIATHTLELDRAIAITGDTVVTCEAFCSPGATVAGCSFSGVSGRGVRFQSTQGRITGNTFERISNYGMSLGFDWNYWGEGCAVDSVSIGRNSFTDTNFGIATNAERTALSIAQAGWPAVALVSNVTVDQNTFTDVANQGLVARNVNGLTVTDNTVDGYGLYPPFTYTTGSQPPGAGYAYVFDTITGLAQSGNAYSGGGSYAEGGIYIPPGQ